MPDNKFYLPIKSVLDMKTGKVISEEHIEVTKEEYFEYLRPLAKILAEGFVRDFLKQKAV